MASFLGLLVVGSRGVTLFQACQVPYRLIFLGQPEAATEAMAAIA